MSRPEDNLSTPADVALADDTASLDAEHPMNRTLRDNGVGLVPRVHRVNLAEKYAVIAAGAILSSFRLPLGWHVIDDGRRTLVFDAAGKVQINLTLHQGALTRDAILDECARHYREQQPDIILTSIEPLGHKILIACNLRTDREELSQCVWPMEVSPGTWIQCRVTGPADGDGRAIDVAGVIMLSLRHGAAIEPPDPETAQ